MTAVVKWVVPVLVLAVCVAMLVDEAGQPPKYTRIYLGAFVFAIYLAVYFPVFWPLADTVNDAGDALLVRRLGNTRRVGLEHVIDVSFLPGSRGVPTRIVLELLASAGLGNRIVFMPDADRMAPNGRNAVADDLQDRARVARSAARA
jgi:hypothetical protein